MIMGRSMLKFMRSVARFTDALRYQNWLRRLPSMRLFQNDAIGMQVSASNTVTVTIQHPSNTRPTSVNLRIHAMQKKMRWYYRRLQILRWHMAKL